MTKLALMEAEIRDLRKANDMLSKRRRCKKTCLQAGGSLNLEGAQAILDKKGVGAQIIQEMRQGRGRKEREEGRARHCGNCKATGHNARTCQIVIASSDEHDFE